MRTASNNNAVVRGGVDWEDPSGFYAGLWTSSLGGSFFDPEEDKVIRPGQELNLYLGYGFSVGEFDFDVGYAYSHYPSLDDEDVGEIYGEVAYGPVYFGIDYTIHADDNGGDSGDITYRLGAEYEIIPTISLNGDIGYADPDASDEDSVTFWQLGLTKATDIGDFSLTYGSTNESGSQDLFVVGYSIRF